MLNCRGSGQRALLVLAAFSCAALWGQTTQGLISGRLLDSGSGRPLAGGRVRYWSDRTNTQGLALSDSSGAFTLPLLSPGDYRLRAEADGYQGQEVYELNVPVAARLDVEFRLRPLSDVWEQGQYRSVFLPGTRTVVTFYGPDVDNSRSASFETRNIETGTLQPAVSDVVDTIQIRDLPLAGRDVYATLAMQPAVASDVAAARGLGLAANGQRPSSSNFLLDGFENNNYLVTGPLTPIAPESIQEYRVSTSSYSAAYGRTAGYIANTVSRSGGNELHGTGYYYVKNEALNANEFQRNRKGVPRKRLREFQTGLQAGGPLIRDRLFFSGAFEHLDSASEREPETILLPTPEFVTDYTAPGSRARELLTAFPAPAVEPGRFPWAGELTVVPPVGVTRYLGIGRLDYQRDADRLMGRFTLARESQPQFLWNPYPDFTSGLKHNTWSLAAAWTRNPAPGLTNELRAGYSGDRLFWDRPHPDIPTLLSADGVALPGSVAFYAYLNDNSTVEISDSLLWNRDAHTVSLGGGFLFRRSDGHLTAGRDGQYGFGNVIFFGLDRPEFFSASVDRAALTARVQPRFDREYRNRQWFAFLEESWRAAPSLTLSLGVRYEFLGAPRNTGAVADGELLLGDGADLTGRLTGARLVFPEGGGQQLYTEDRNNWAVRTGFGYRLPGTRHTVVRGAYGIFYDRPFDNLWQNTRNNNLTLPLFLVNRRFDYLQPVGDALAEFADQPVLGDFPSLTTHDPGFRSGYSQHYMVGLQQNMGEHWSLEVNGLGSQGRKLVTSDLINRQFTLSAGDGRPNPNLPDIAWRASQGSSGYHALTASLRYGTGPVQARASYAWSHAIDNQSEPLAGDFFDLSFARFSSGSSSRSRAAFARQYDSGGDRGNADFDQRHNLMLTVIAELPSPRRDGLSQALLRNWRVAALGAWRSGFPYSVYSVSRAEFGEGLIVNNRADLVDPAAVEPSGNSAIAGGELLLAREAFRSPAPSALGNLGRNAFPGPSFSSLNLSLSRSFALSCIGDQGRLVVRADAFNVLNSVNLNPPDSLLESETFGMAQYGRRGRDTGFPAASPLNESAREIQLMLRVQF